MVAHLLSRELGELVMVIVADSIGRTRPLGRVILISEVEEFINP
jgi:hypothetical protein